MYESIISVTMSKRELLIVGAGITGCATAARLSKSLPELAVTVWDKAKGAGGRMSTHRHSDSSGGPEPLHADMGAQYISRFQTEESNQEFGSWKESIYSDLISRGSLAPFQGTIEGDRVPPRPILANFVAPQGLSTLARYFLSQCSARTHFQHQLTSASLGREGTIHCTATNGVEGEFDALVLTMPVPQVLSIAGNLFPSPASSTTASKLANVKYSSRYAVGLFYDRNTPVPECNWTAKYCDSSIIRYMCWDTAKRGAKTAGKTLLIHTTVPFGIKHLESDKSVVQDLILKELKMLIPQLPDATHSHCIRWRYSQVFEPYAYPDHMTAAAQEVRGCVVLREKPLVVVTGDGFTTSTFEGCLQASYATSQVVNSYFKF